MIWVRATQDAVGDTFEVGKVNSSCYQFEITIISRLPWEDQIWQVKDYV